MDTMRAVLADPVLPERLAITEVEAPAPERNEALVRVAAFSLNRGEVRGAMNATTATRPGWDVAGFVERAAADGTGPAVGTRVVGFVSSGAWAELVAVPSDAIATLPGEVPFAAAATLPVAGLTALHAVERGSGLLGRRVLVTGASGGVGLYACQLARLSGARVFGLLRQPGHANTVEQAGAEQAIVSAAGSEAAQYGRFKLIVESVGGQVLANALSMLAVDGVCVSFGATADYEVTFNLWSLVGAGRASLYGLGLFNEVKREPAGIGLERLVSLMSTGQIRPFIALESPWGEIADVARQLLDRRFAGKAVLHVL